MNDRVHAAFAVIKALMEDPLERIVIDFYGLKETCSEEYEELQAALIQEFLEQTGIYDSGFLDSGYDGLDLLH